MAKFYRLLILSTALMATVNSAFADGYGFADDEVEVEATFRRALSLTVDHDLNFTTTAGTPIEFTAAPGSSDLIRLATNGSIAYDGVFSGPSTGQYGQVTISGDAESAIEISCSTGATLEDAAANQVSVNEVRIEMNGGAAWGSSDYTCAGVSTSPYTAHTLDGSDLFRIGAQIEGNNTLASNAYSTATGNGVPITVRVDYQ